MATQITSVNQATQDPDGRAIVVSQRGEMFSGPLPPPEMFEKYERVLPGLADRITKMAESQSEHRQKLETSVINFDKIKSLLGLVFAFLIVICAIVAGTFLIFKGKPWGGSVIALFPLSTIVGMFIYQQYWRGGTVSNKQGE